MATKILRVFQEFTSEGYVPMPPTGNIDYGVTIANTFPTTTPATFQTDNPDLEVEVTTVTDFYVWIRSHGTEWNYQYTRNVRVYPDSAQINNVVMGIIIANLGDVVPYTGAVKNVDLGEFGIKAGNLSLDTTPTNIPTTEGTIFWDFGDGQLNVNLLNGVVSHIGGDLPVLVKKDDNSGLTKGKVVYEKGSDGANTTVMYAQANAESTSSKTFGVIANTTNGGAKAYCITFGYIRNIDTSSLTEGSTIYLSPTDAGGMTTTKPQAPNHLVTVGRCIRSHATQGIIFVSIQNGFELDELHDVQILSKTNNDILVYDSTTSLWKNKSVLKTNGYIPYFDSTNFFNKSVIYSTDSYASIGTTTALDNALLTVQGAIWGEEINLNSNALIHTSILSGNFFISRLTDSNWKVMLTFEANLITSSVDFEATKFIKTGGLSSQFLLADGSVNTITGLHIITGGGNSNYVTKYGSTYELMQSLIYDNGTNVGVGSTNPQFKFEVRGGAMGVYASSTSYGKQELANNDYMFTSATGYYFNVNNATLPTFAGRIDSLANWGIGILNPSYKLDVNGSVNIASGSNYYINGVQLNTDQIPQGSTNKYLTEEGLYPLMYNFQSGEIRWNVVTHKFYMNQATTNSNGWLSNTDWNTFNNKQDSLGFSPVPNTRTLTINGTTYDLSANRTWTINGVISGLSTGYITRASSASSIENSSIYDSGTGIGINTTNTTARKLVIGGNLGGNATSVGILNNPIVQSEVSNAIFYQSNLNTVAGSYTINTAYHYYASQGTIGSGNTITAQYGYFIDSTFTGATNNFGFYSNLAFGTGRWNIYMAGTASNYFAGSIGVGTTGVASTTMNIAKTIVGNGSTTGYQILSQGQVQSDVTNFAYYFRTFASTQASSFTLTNLYHFTASQSTLGAGSSVSIQSGFTAEASLVGAGTNYGFAGYIPSGTNRWNLYMAGTASNYLAGTLGIGISSITSKISVAVTGVNNSTQSVLNATTDNPTYRASIQLVRETVSGQLGWAFTTNAITSGEGTERLRITSAGSVGINTTSPAYTLDVNGTINGTSIRITGGTSTQYLMANGTTSTLTDVLVTGKLLTGLSITGTSVQATDSILIAIGKLQNQLNSLTGSLSYRGTWNASTNNPTITSGTGTNGYFYIVSVAGTTTIDGISSWAVGDWIIFNGTTWQKVANNSVTSVNGKTGTVVLTTSDISEGSNLYFTNARAIASTLTGYVSGTGTISSSDTIISAIQKLNGNISALVTGVSQVNGQTGIVTLTSSNISEGNNLYFTNARSISATLTGYTSGSGTITSSDTILQAIQKLNGNFVSIFSGTSSQFVKANGTTSEIATDLDSDISGIRDGSNKLFTISANFVSNSTRVFVNGVRMQRGSLNDYIEVGSNQIQFTVAPDSGDIILVDYIK